MASSRLERIGTIFTRVEGLLRSKAMQPEDRPLWWDVYKAFPPITEPTFDRPKQNIEIKPIFYLEDKIRAKFHASGEPLGSVNLKDSVQKTNSQYLLTICENLKKENSKMQNSELYEKALGVLKEKIEFAKENLSDERSQTDKDTPRRFSDVKTEKISSNIKDLLNE